MNPMTSVEETIDKIQFLLEKSTNNGVLRDEILVQICKQITGNPSM